MRPCIALAVGFLLVVSPLRGQTPRLTVEVDTAVVTVGDLVTLRVSVDHAAGDRVLWPDSLDLAPFEITGARAFPPAAQGERVRSAAVFSLVAFELGDLEIPSFNVEVLNETGESAILSTNPFGIRVVSVGLEEGGDIREIKGPLGIPLSVARVLLLALVALITAAIVWAFYRKIKGREHRMPAPVSTPHSRPP
ncbi:MAG: hypothetical protein MUO50_10040, partial [Longimicrobiales bacterium]|nr:hypothetical protein [Longimicrobiales bacterium]